MVTLGVFFMKFHQNIHYMQNVPHDLGNTFRTCFQKHMVQSSFSQNRMVIFTHLELKNTPLPFCAA